MQKQWIEYVYLQTGSNPTLALNKNGMDHPVVKVAYEAAMDTPKRKQYLDLSTRLLAIELANGEVKSARNSRVMTLIAARDQRVANALDKADAKKDAAAGTTTMRHPFVLPGSNSKPCLPCLRI